MTWPHNTPLTLIWPNVPRPGWFHPEVHAQGQPFVYMPNSEQPFSTRWTMQGMAGWWFCPVHGYVTFTRKHRECFAYKPLGRHDAPQPT